MTNQTPSFQNKKDFLIKYLTTTLSYPSVITLHINYDNEISFNFANLYLTIVN